MDQNISLTTSQSHEGLAGYLLRTLYPMKAEGNRKPLWVASRAFCNGMKTQHVKIVTYADGFN